MQYKMWCTVFNLSSYYENNTFKTREEQISFIYIEFVMKCVFI